jgi:hypothetical protein
MKDLNEINNYRSVFYSALSFYLVPILQQHIHKSKVTVAYNSLIIIFLKYALWP